MRLLFEKTATIKTAKMFLNLTKISKVRNKSMKNPLTLFVQCASNQFFPAQTATSIGTWVMPMALAA